MPNQDFPGVCWSCVDDACAVVAPDLATVRERVRSEPLEDYTLNVVNNLTTAMPDKFADKDEAFLAFDVVKAVIAMGLKNKDDVTFKGIGSFANEGGKLVFTPDAALETMMNE